MIDLDFRQVYYQVLLKIYVKFIVKNVEINTVNMNVSLKDLELTNSLIDGVSVKKKQLKRINGLIRKIPNRYKFWNSDINKVILLLRKGVDPYEYMGCWKRFDEASLPDKKAVYSNLYREVIKDIDCKHTERIWKYLK